MLALLGYRRKDIADYIGIDKSNITRILNGAGQGRVALRVGRVLHELIKATT
jgi:DNA-binding Xre family transcriptional regulator